jgi:hypothetical protein
VQPDALARGSRPLRPELGVLRLTVGETPIFAEVAKLYPELEWHQDYEVLRNWQGDLRLVLTGRLYTYPLAELQD